MKIGEIKLQTIESDVGMVLTNGEAYKEGIVYLGCNDKPENWHEISVEEYEAKMKELEDEIIEG